MPQDTRGVADAKTDPATVATGKTAVLYRMDLPNHLCPAGQKARWLLKRKGYEVDDRLFRARPEVDAFKAQHDVPTTPQVWIEGKRVGGYDALRQKLTDYDPAETTYKPVIYLFAVAAATALALSIGFLGAITWQTLGWFISVSMILLGMQKLSDIESFTTMFLNYDVLARKWVPYAYVYPWIETGAGVLMTGMLLTSLAAPAALFIATVGAISVFKAVYIDKRELKCACVGGNSNVPLGFVSLSENLMMMGMAIVMLITMFT
ncbi:glutaredoxin [Sulfitobacter sp. KE34]|uniref:MauE/DoxX family redox-associated membrane protein n=1 Tax=unclassified Sulfitobacter TaxID=196795 RepID=UPI0023E24B1A|nr:MULTISPECIES: MauE/DoxX family redox-associated membrane protein [unclassified Sulfitobacter]MDF3352079.1 glutaredoxin [Sulfitobacter sp. KE12]MDF3355723.1 glutaredoxin [Sulfitobacter sp. KE27]MDF3359362.1 glutaredoxin [Sulfitobacter sp. KE33]MDF3366786.1 glutaredoxin [Sulfitobacter sp. Ks34]MDF3370404.1 glutaredoxin [Sulfitobacter sp. Ks43]